VFHTLNIEYFPCQLADIYMGDTELETSVKTKNSPQIEEGQQGQQKQETVTYIEHEIECPRCYDTMTLRSDFDSLYYFCEECAFILYTVRRR
jgi:formamidopyrimidine-DNA glycosylase